MTVTQEQIDTLNSRVEGLNQAIADGVRQVTIGDHTLTYNTTASLIQARDDTLGQLQRATAQFKGRPRPRQTGLFYAGRGYN